MGPKKKPKTPEEILDVVVLIEEDLYSSRLGDFIVETMSKESFAENGRVKCLGQKSEIPQSIQWMTKVSTNEWKVSEFVHVLYPSSKFFELFRLYPHMDVNQLLLEILGQLPNPETEKFYVSLFKDRTTNKTGNTNQDKSLEEELKQGYLRKAHDLTVDSLMLYKTTLNLSQIDKIEASTKIIKSTKSVLESVKPPQDFGSWYPKHDSKQSVTVGKNKVGLNKLWQRYLMEISQNVNVEQAKVISADQDFSSLNRAVKTYSNCMHDEKHAVEILSKKALRPNGATKDSLTLGNKRPSVGVETSRKVFKVLTTLDPALEI